MISADQLTIAAASGSEAKQTAAAIVKADKQTAPSTPGQRDAKSYTIEEFSAMTYLTPFGVERYLKQGRLSGTKNASGQWLVHRTNLDKAEIQRLVRK